MKTLDRRSLLKLVSTSPLLWGAKRLWAAPQDPEATKKPAWFLAALRQARTRKAPVVVVVMPDLTQKELPTKALQEQQARFQKRLRTLCKTASQRAWFTIRFEDRMARMAVYLQLLLDSKDPAMQELLLESVWMCAPAALVGAEKSEVVVTLDSRGRRTGGAILDLGNEADVIGKLQHLLHGKDDTRLHKRAKAAGTEEIAGAIQDLVADDATRRNQARALLSKDLDAAMPAIIEFRHHHHDAGLRRALGEILTTAYEHARKHDYRGLLPFGTKLEQQMVYDPCPPCGMARIPAGSLKMLKLLGK